jgi:hypothetical protein
MLVNQGVRAESAGGAAVKNKANREHRWYEQTQLAEAGTLGRVIWTPAFAGVTVAGTNHARQSQNQSWGARRDIRDNALRRHYKHRADRAEQSQSASPSTRAAEELVGQAPPYKKDVGRGRPTYEETIV